MGFLVDLATHIKSWANTKFAPISGSANYEPKNTNIQTHISSTSNPHATTAAQVGLGSVTNNAQVKKSASSTDGNIVVWSGTTGDTLGAGYTVQTTLSSSSTAIPRADAVKAAIDAVSSGTGSALFTPVADLTALKAVNTTSAVTYPDKGLVLVEALGLYRLDRDSSATADDNLVIAPTTGVGRWLKMSAPTNDHGLLSGMQGGATSEYYHLTLAYYQALAGTNGTPSGTNKYVTSSDGKLTNLTATGTFPVTYIDVLTAEWTAFDNALNA